MNLIGVTSLVEFGSTKLMFDYLFYNYFTYFLLRTTITREIFYCGPNHLTNLLQRQDYQMQSQFYPQMHFQSYKVQPNYLLYYIVRSKKAVFYLNTHFLVTEH